MKKYLLTILLFVGGVLFFNAFGGQNVPMQIINPGSAGNISTKGPLGPVTVVQDDYVLTFPASEDDLTLELRDATDTMVYSTYLPAGTTTVVLPSTLSGSFELRLVPLFATYYYRGYIDL